MVGGEHTHAEGGDVERFIVGHEEVKRKGAGKGDGTEGPLEVDILL